MNPGFTNLQSYPFEKLAILQKETVAAQMLPIDLSIGEPKHPTPAFILQELVNHLQGAGKYPPVRGSQALRETISDWLTARYHLPAGSITAEEHVLPVNGTREALFSIAHCIIDSCGKEAMVVTGNPFYQIYEGAAFFAGAGVWYVNNSKKNGLLPDYTLVPASVWEKCQLLYICSPNNPTGETIDQSDYETLFELADKHDFVIAADECYSEIYLDEENPPLGILQAASISNRNDFSRCLVFHSLSKRSNVPGMRSGFVAGDSRLIKEFYRYRTYHGCAMSPFIQAASMAAWNDEKHVAENRRLYREKFDAVLDILAPVMPVHRPQAGFYLWAQTPVDDVEFTRQLIARQNVRVLPGSFTAREIDDVNPGAGRIRIALVASLDECVQAAGRIRTLLDTF